MLRPDCALYRGIAQIGFLDAKYRDVWERGLPPEWLYQLSIYALASPVHVSVLLYASMAPDARDERVEVRQPGLWTSKGLASVILRPVLLSKLAELVDPAQARSMTAERRRWAEELVTPITHNPAETGPRSDVKVL